MTYDFGDLKQKISDTQVWLKKEYMGIRTGRATPALLDSIQVDSYGAQLPISQVASVGVEDACTLKITPWDVSQSKEIEKAITRADIGVSVVTDEKGIRVIFPELTSERREQLLKLMNDKREDARVSLRGARDETWSEIQKKEKEKEVGEDDKFRFKEEMEKMIQDAHIGLDAIVERKEKEIAS